MFKIPDYRTTIYRSRTRARACNFIKTESLTQVFSCEFCEISKNPFLQNTSGGCFYIYDSRLHNKYPQKKIFEN